MVEFALIAPLFFLLIFGLVIAAIVVTNQIQLTNVARDGARAAAVCGGAGAQSASGTPGAPFTTTKTLPNGQPCTTAELYKYINGELVAIAGGASPSVQVIVGGGDLTTCQKGMLVQVNVSMKQPLYAPLIGFAFGDPSNRSVRTLTGSAQAVCEQ